MKYETDFEIQNIARDIITKLNLNHIDTETFMRKES